MSYPAVAPDAPPVTPSPTSSRFKRLAAKLGVGYLVFCTLKGLVYIALASGGAAAIWR